MKAALKIIYDWPVLPALPLPGQPVLIRVPTAQSRPAARQELRAVLRQTLARWGGFLPEQLPLHETAAGPVWPGLLGGLALDISLSYADSEGWIGLLRGGRIGVDAMRIQPIAEAAAVARHYLDPADLKNTRCSTDPALAFAVAWTGLEARLKCIKQGLNEWTGASAPVMTDCILQNFILPERRVVTVATSLS